MSATYSQLATIAASSDFQQRTAIAMNKAAGSIYNEGSGVTNHSARAAFAIKVSNGNYTLSAISLAVITASAIIAEAVVGTFGNAIADSDIDNSVASLWNMFAGI